MRLRFASPHALLLTLSLMLFPQQNVYSGQTFTLSGIEGSVNTQISLGILRPAYKALGHEISYLALPGERSIRSSNQGKTDGEVFRIANVDKRYPNLVPVPTPINTLQAVAFSKKLRFNVNGWESLRSYRIGIQVGIKFAERGTKGMQRIVVDTNEQLFKMLDKDRVDIVVVALANGLQSLNALNIDGIHRLHPTIQEYPLFHYVHKKHAQLVPKLDKQFQRLKNNGHMNKVREDFIAQLQQTQIKSFVQQ